MLVIRARNVHSALPIAIRHLLEEGILCDSRNGPVLRYPTPVTTILMNPRERVVFWPERNANPFFHLMESLWMLAGRDDVAWIATFNRRMKEYSDDGVSLPGAYGYRWRRHFGHDQIARTIRLLNEEPLTRRAVIQMYDPAVDQHISETATKDVPCNTTIFLSRRSGRLEMTVCCRSNDLIWGAYGANAVHFSVLQEYIAFALGTLVGPLYLISNDLHIYQAVLTDALRSLPEKTVNDPYSKNVRAKPLINTSLDDWDYSLDRFMYGGGGYVDSFFSDVVEPLRAAYSHYKAGDCTSALKKARLCAAPDWKKASVEWLQRVIANKASSKSS